MPPLEIMADSLTDRGFGKIRLNARTDTLWSDGAVEATELGVPHVSRGRFHKRLESPANDGEREPGELSILGGTKNVFNHGKSSFPFGNGNPEAGDFPRVQKKPTILDNLDQRSEFLGVA
jgi:hypothetical protein